MLLVVALAAARGLDRIVPGAADGSFGPVVGVLAGVPFAVAVFAHLAGRTGAADRRVAERSEGPVAT